ncbi:MAG: HAMP domain-containing sensor histidine kinase [Oscillospiraceae bacterium]|nr:HAMP domain-containing sensor histidine kinase [Oscillospiraceae bacterium]
MGVIFPVVCIVLFVFSLASVLRLAHLKREIRHFTDELIKHTDKNYAQPLKLTCFDKDIIQLAVSINGQLDADLKLAAEYEKDKKRLNNVISGISHDFRTPLTASLGYLQMIKKSGELSDNNSVWLDIAISKNEYLKELSDEFFELTKMRCENDSIEEETINFSNMVSDCIMEQYSWVEERNIDPSFDIQDAVFIRTSPSYMMRILQNLFSNAQKYTNEHFGVTLSRRDDIVMLRVYNDIYDKNDIDLSRVFEPFYKAYSRSRKGSGLGLYVVKYLSRKLGFTAEASLNNDLVFEVCITIKTDVYNTE